MSSAAPEPTVATRRDPSRITAAGRAAVVAERYLGKQLWPWQRRVLEVALERRADGTPQYKNVICSVPRQSGKTEMLGALLLLRMLEGRWCWYTAQTRSEAFDTFIMRWAPAWEAAPFGITARRSAEMPGGYAPNGGAVRIFRPNGYGLHGKQADLIVVDEAWGLDYATGRELEQAAGPTGQTRPEYQKWIISTAGDSDAAYLAEALASARLLEHTPDARTAVFIWDATGVDPDDLEAILDRHPARGTPMQAQAFDHIRAEFERMPRDEFLRAYGNVWPAEASATGFADRFARTADLQLALPAPRTRGLIFGVDASPMGDHASIVAAWPTDTGPATAVVTTRGGTAWLTDELRDLSRRWRPAGIRCDQLSMAAGPVKAAQLPGVHFTDTREICAAAGYMLDPDTTYRHRPDPELSAAAESMRPRRIGDRTAFGRSSSGAPVDPLVAASIATHAVAAPARHAAFVV